MKGASEGHPRGFCLLLSEVEVASLEAGLQDPGSTPRVVPMVPEVLTLSGLALTFFLESPRVHRSSSQGPELGGAPDQTSLHHPDRLASAAGGGPDYPGPSRGAPAAGPGMGYLTSTATPC